MSLRRVSIGLFVIGLGGGTLLDFQAPQKEPPRRGDYVVLQADFHVHGFPGDGWLTPFGLIHEAKRRGLDAFALTNHNQVLTARIARALSQALDGPIVLIGQEITSPAYHIIAAGIEHTVEWRQPASGAIADTQAQGGVAIAAHPTERFLPNLVPVLPELDGAERMHSLIYFDEDEAANLREFYRLGNSDGERLTAIGSSDYHAFHTLGLARTLVFARSKEPTAVLEAVRQGHTVVRDETGAFHGDPEMIRLITEQPLNDSDNDYGYRGAGSFDRITRTCGWLGLLGLLSLRGWRGRLSDRRRRTGPG